MKASNWTPLEFDAEFVTSKEFQFFGGIEELKDYKIINSNSNVKSKKRKLKQQQQITNKKVKPEHNEINIIEDVQVNNEDNSDMSAWSNCFVPEPILKALQDLGFNKPTPIQELAIPPAIRDFQDILGAAETGSGKTLAFGIPIISQLISYKEDMQNTDSTIKNQLRCLILTPTRELAIQVKKHLHAICKYTDIKVTVVVGGMASEKQKRILKKCPDIVVATPGRLWELIEEGEEYLNNLNNIKYLVIDEADRMVEKGHFAELQEIISLINQSKTKRQTFVFSATLTLIHEGPKKMTLKNKKGKLKKKEKLDSLINLLGMKVKPKVIDITKKTALVETLTESQIMCSKEEKDLYIYYFILKYPGRTLIFCNSIDSVRRLRTILEYLECNPLPLHASMQQRQRLKNLERFESSKNGVLLATDVAARGLDIKGIEHVIHFQVPRTAEIYVHRSGRTARAQAEGLSLILIDPKDAVFYKRICKTLNKDKSLPTFPVDYNILKFVKERVNLAKNIDKLEHRLQRLNAQNRWFLNAAKETEIDIEDDENLLNNLGDEKERANKTKKIKAMKKQLKIMLSKSIFSKVYLSKYPSKLKLPELSIPGSEKAIKVVKKELNATTKKSKNKFKK